MAGTLGHRERHFLGCSGAASELTRLYVSGPRLGPRPPQLFLPPFILFRFLSFVNATATHSTAIKSTRRGCLVKPELYLQENSMTHLRYNSSKEDVVHAHTHTRRTRGQHRGPAATAPFAGTRTLIWQNSRVRKKRRRQLLRRRCRTTHT